MDYKPTDFNQSERWATSSPLHIQMTEAFLSFFFGVDASDKYGSNSSPSNPLSTPPQTVQGFYLTQEINRTSMSRSMSQRGRRFTVTSRLNRKHLSTRTESDSKDIGSISLQDAPSELEFNAVSEGYMTGIEEADELWTRKRASRPIYVLEAKGRCPLGW